MMPLEEHLKGCLVCKTAGQQAMFSADTEEQFRTMLFGAACAEGKKMLEAAKAAATGNKVA